MNAERMVVARPADSNLGPIRAREPDAVLEMIRLRRGGVSMAVIAEQFGVSVRTAYRYMGAGIRYYDVEVAGWVATFARKPGEAPWRVSSWRRKR